MKFCEVAIVKLLEGVSTRIHPIVAPQNSQAPFIIYNRIDGQRWRSINKPSGMAQVSIQIDAYAKTYTESKELAGQIETVLDGYRGTVYYGADSPQDFVRIAGISLENEVDILDQTDQPYLYRVSATYLVTYDQE